MCRSEGEYVLAELTDRIGLDEDYDDLRGCWVRTANGEIVRNPPRLLIPDLDVLPPADLSPDNKYYLGLNAWRDVARWDERARLLRHHGGARVPVRVHLLHPQLHAQGDRRARHLLRRRSVDHVMAELREAVRAAAAARARSPSATTSSRRRGRGWRSSARATSRRSGCRSSCTRIPRMVDEQRRRSSCATPASGARRWASSPAPSASGATATSARPRNEEIIEACEILARHGVGRNLDFIGDNPYETRRRSRARRVDLLCRLPKPFYFNYFSLTYFPGVDLTDRALRDGLIRPRGRRGRRRRRATTSGAAR